MNESMFKRIDWIFIALSCLLFWKTFFLYTHNHLAPDGAIIGLMAKHILHGNFPTFFYGYGYIGSLKSGIAAVLFLFFGATKGTLLLLPALFYVGFVWTTYWYLLLIANRKAARIAMLLTIIGSHWLTTFAAEIIGGYMDTLLYGNLLLIFLHKFCLAESHQKWKWSLALGFLGGLAFWQFPLIGYYLVTVFFIGFIFRPQNMFSKQILFFFGSFALGSFPSWFYNLHHDFVSFSMVSKASWHEFWNYFIAFFKAYIPAILGWDFHAHLLQFKLAWLAISLISLYALFFLIKQIKWKWHDPKMPLLVLFIFVLFLFCRNHYTGERSPMVVLPILFLFPGLIALFLTELSHFSKILFWSSILLFTLPYVAQTHNSMLGRQQNAELFEQVQNNYLAALQKHQVTEGYVPYYIAAPLNFCTNETITLSSLYEESVPLYQDKVASSLKPGFIMPKTALETQTFETMLNALGCDYQKEEVENHFLFHHITQNRPLGQEISKHGLKTDPKIFDRDITTRWSTYEPQKPGQSIEIELPKKHILTGLELHSLGFNDMPRALKIEISQNGTDWKAVFENRVSPFYWSAAHPFTTYETGRLEIVIPPTIGRFVRLTQTGKAGTYYWSIHELYLFEKTNSEIEKNSLYATQLTQQIPNSTQLKEKYLYTDSWLSAKLAANPKTKDLDYLPLHNPRSHLSQTIPQTSQVTRFIDWNKNPVFIIEKTEESSFENSEAYNPKKWDKRSQGLWTLYEWKEASKKTLSEISRKKWKASASHRSGKAKNAIQGKRNQIWKSIEAQKEGMYFMLDLGGTKTVREIQLYSNHSDWEYPRYFEVLTSKDNQNWQKADILQKGASYWDGKRILQATLKNRMLPITISPTPLRYLKIRITQDFPQNQWRISNIKLFE